MAQHKASHHLHAQIFALQIRFALKAPPIRCRVAATAARQQTQLQQRNVYACLAMVVFRVICVALVNTGKQACVHPVPLACTAQPLAKLPLNAQPLAPQTRSALRAPLSLLLVLLVSSAHQEQKRKQTVCAHLDSGTILNLARVCCVRSACIPRSLHARRVWLALRMQTPQQLAATRLQTARVLLVTHQMASSVHRVVLARSKRHPVLACVLHAQQEVILSPLQQHVSAALQEPTATQAA